MQDVSDGINEIPRAGVEAVDRVLDGQVLILTVELRKNADDQVLRHVLQSVSIVAADEILVLTHAYNAMHNIITGAVGIQSDVHGREVLGRLYDIDAVAVGFKERPHADAARH